MPAIKIPAPSSCPPSATMESHCLLLLLLSLLSVIVSFFLFFKPRSTAKSTVGGLRPYPILGHLPQFMRNRERFHDWITDCLAATPTATIVFRRPGGIRGVITANPSNVEHILRASFDKYPKGPRFRSNLADFLGRGIFNADGPLWRAQRKTASFEFNTRSLRSFVLHTVQREIFSRLLPLLSAAAAAGGTATIDLQDALERFAFDNICNVAFGVDPACLAPEGGGGGDGDGGFARAFKDAANLSAERFRSAVPRSWKLKKLLDIGSERRLRESIATVNEFAMQIIRSRKKEMQSSSSSTSSAPKDDLLSRFIAGDDDSDEYLRDIVISFLLAGRDTTSAALTWFFWLLSSRPDVEMKILEEIASLRERSAGEAFDFDELREMHYTHAAITESMRLYPPVPVNSTACMADDVLPDGTEVKRGWFASYNSYAMGRMEAVWGEDCTEYRPERWIGDGGVFRPESPFRFPAFHAGPRMCLGKEMAYIQMKSILACVLERFEVAVADDAAAAPPEQLISLTLRMKGGLPVRLKERRVAIG